MDTTKNMTIHAMVENFLEKTPLFRERSQKDRGIVHLLLLQHGEREIWPPVATKEFLTGFVKDYASADRAWRQILRHRPELRGTDYWDKIKLMDSKRKKLGY